ncbi:Alpha/Beta hydrolase protein [Apodospora peruviana]|uniref:Alpha/Beta hydrolase protein n=1 Tax=Apodospora peruviana TaxID=516989 RepID=A0AAE0I1K7_9PEZI|nr:Alpha/Beta hydrolase protein [Apodospora peruviana]
MLGSPILLKSLLLSAAAFCASTTAGPTTASTTKKVCTNYKIPVTISSTNLVFAHPFRDNYDVADFVTIADSRDEGARADVINGTTTLSGSYTIGATFCTPATGQSDAHKSTVLLATHGLLFDRTYWDPALNKTRYSFVDWSINQGYSVFYYDRLGVGESSKVSGYVAQLNDQVEILTALTKLVKAGNYVGNLGQPKAVVLVGHSFGSNLAVQTAANDLNIADGLILTGYSFDQRYQNPGGTAAAVGFRIAKTLSPQKWGDLDTGYLVPVDQYPIATTYFKEPDYEKSAIEYTNANKQPVGIIEVLTSTIPNTFPNGYTGVVMILTGQYDFIFCTSLCTDEILTNSAAPIFKDAKAFTAKAYPGASHGLNLAANAAGSFKLITDFLSANGL